jgi:Flp pilus assembly protein TadD
MKDANYYFERGKAHAGKEDYDSAIADYTQVIRLDPNDAVAYSSRGLAYNTKGQKALAIKDLEKALSLTPNDKWTQDTLKAIRGR